MKSSKIVGTALGLLLGIAILGGLAGAFAGLLMLAWNIVGVAVLSIAIPLTFLTALKGVGILYGVFILTSIIRTVTQNYMQKIQMRAVMKMMRKFDEETVKKQEGDTLGHFRMN